MDPDPIVLSGYPFAGATQDLVSLILSCIRELSLYSQVEFVLAFLGHPTRLSFVRLNSPEPCLIMTEIKLRRGEPVEKALRRLKKQLIREQILLQVRLHRHFEKPSVRKRRKQKAARFSSMLRERAAEQ